MQWQVRCFMHGDTSAALYTKFAVIVLPPEPTYPVTLFTILSYIDYSQNSPK